MTVYFRLFAGFTSFISKRCLSHFCSSGPAGIFDSSSMTHRSNAGDDARPERAVNPSHTTSAIAERDPPVERIRSTASRSRACGPSSTRRDTGAGPSAIIATM